MNLLDDIPEGAVVALDTAPIIYYVENHPTYNPIVRPFFVVRLQAARNVALTSTVSLVEVLVVPLRTGRLDLVCDYQDFLVSFPVIDLVPVSTPVAGWAADLRARYNLRLGDACQMGAALANGATHFLTNDAQLRRVMELTVLILNDYLPPAAPAAATGPVP
jgi:predicted nucleic acid-binding protein